MNTLRSFSLLAIAVLLPVGLSAREEHPMMHEAATHIQAARTSAQPVDDLKKALRSLRGAAPNKAGKRVDAAVLVQRAITILEDSKRPATDRRTEADKLMREALSSIEKGVALRPRDKTRR